MRGRAPLSFEGEEITAPAYGSSLIENAAHELELVNLFRFAAGLPEITPTNAPGQTASTSKEALAAH